jgi:uncharacterized protein (DUF608 family)
MPHLHWPILKHYDHAHLARIALPLGGIGTGTVSLGGRGNLRDWEIGNRPAKGFTPTVARVGPFFALYARAGDDPATLRLLEGPLELTEYEGQSGAPVPNHGLPRFRECAFDAAYPLGQVSLHDDDVPLDVRLDAFNPLAPPDADRSGLPIAVLRYVLTNPGDRPVTATIVGSVPNFVGADGSKTAPGPKGNRNVFRAGEEAQGIFMTSDGVAASAEQWGTIALAVVTPSERSRHPERRNEVEGRLRSDLAGAASFDSSRHTSPGSAQDARRIAQEITYRTDWLKPHWGTSLLDFWDDLAADGRLDRRQPSGAEMPMGSLAASLTVPPGETVSVTFLLAWHFPNRMTWTPKKEGDAGACECGGECGDPNRIGNYYAARFRDAWDVIETVAPQLPALEADTVAFVSAFCASDLPDVVKEAALFNLSTLRSQTCFRTPDGRFYGWEGCSDQTGCCHGSCTHVWNYEVTTPFLFGDLALRMREVEFGHATRNDGMMAFRVHLPIARGQEFGKAAADGQMGCLMKMYRDWQLSGDDALLRTLWPQVRAAVEFCWIPGGWDADQDGVMEGCQHNTMDVEYYGPNPQMEGWYLGALRAAEEMARHLGEADFAAKCRALFERGRTWTDAHLFNGEYYEHEIRPPKRLDDVAASLLVGMGAADLGHPDYQLGPGCLVDQLVGQYMAHVCGLGYVLDPGHVLDTLRSILKYNRQQGFDAHFNCMRSYALGDETALLMASYPHGRPANPFPYFTEVMTGFEYTAAVGMLYEGQIEAGLSCIRNIRERYDGRKRSPFDEAECGHHYARAMAAWAAVLALTGFGYSAVEQRLTLAANEGTYFWSNGYAWGTYRLLGGELAFTVQRGAIKVGRIVLTGVGETMLSAPQTVSAGQTATWGMRRDA